MKLVRNDEFDGTELYRTKIEISFMLFGKDFETLKKPVPFYTGLQVGMC